MTSQVENPQFIHITETMLRLYVLLNQYLDRCQDQAVKETFPESDFQEHLRNTREQAKTLLGTNRVVKEKVEAEAERILQLGEHSIGRGNDEEIKNKLAQEKEILRIKTLALSDLLAVFRSV